MGSCSNLLMRTALLPRQGQPLKGVGPFESPTMKIDILIFLLKIKGFWRGNLHDQVSYLPKS